MKEQNESRTLNSGELNAQSRHICTVLYVEDDSDDAFLVQRAFEKARLPHRLVHLLDGQQAVDFLSGSPGPAQPPQPDLLLLDLKMPRMDGFEVLSWIQSKPQFKRLPAVVLSSSDHEVDVARARALGAADYFRKPTDPAELVRIVTTIHERWLLKCAPPELSAAA